MIAANSASCPSCRSRWEGSRPLNTNMPVPVPTYDHGPSDNPNFNFRGATYSPPMTVARALREQCNIPFESFFLVAHLGKGHFAYFSGPNSIPENDLNKVFRREKFLQIQKSPSSGEKPPQADCSDDHDLGAAQASLRLDHQRVPQSRGRKRPRSPTSDVDNDPAPVFTTSKRVLEIGDSEAVWDFYAQRFQCIQQVACRAIAKDIIKEIAPKKQATNPYIKGDSAAPSWWPKPWGRGPKDKVRHREPDHQLKDERVHLLTHIMKMMVDPAQQPQEIRSREISMAKLEAITLDALATLSKNNPKYLTKTPIVKELFRVAKMEARYKRNEIDSTTQIFVTADDMVMNHCFDDSDEEGGDEGTVDSEESSDSDSGTSSVASMSPTTTTTALPQTETQTPLPVHHSPVRNQYGAPAAAASAAALAPRQYTYQEASLNHLATAVAAQPPLPVHRDTLASSSQEMLTPSSHQHHNTGRDPSLFTPSAVYYHHQHPVAWEPPTGAPQTRPLQAYPSVAYHHDQQHSLPSLQLPMPMPMPQQTQGQGHGQGHGQGQGYGQGQAAGHCVGGYPQSFGFH